MRELLGLAATILEASSGSSQPGHSATRAVLVLIMTVVAALCGIGVVVCLATALWVYEMPILGEVQAPLVVAGALALVTLVAGLILHLKTQPPPPPPPHPLVGISSYLLNGGLESLMKSNKLIILAGALMAGLAVGESQGRR